MSSINGVGSAYNIGQLNPYGSSATVGGEHRNGSQAGGISGQGNSFVSAIMQALTQIKNTSAAATVAGSASTTSATSDSSSTTSVDPQQALAAFMQALFATLQGLGAQQPGTASNNATSGSTASTTGVDSDGDHDGSSAAAVAGTPGRHHGGGGIEAKLQMLIGQLSSASTAAATTPGTTASATVTPAGNTSSAMLATLQQDFQNMTGASSASGNQTSLANFLQILTQNLRGSNPGLNISTTA